MAKGKFSKPRGPVQPAPEAEYLLPDLPVQPSEDLTLEDVLTATAPAVQLPEETEAAPLDFEQLASQQEAPLEAFFAPTEPETETAQDEEPAMEDIPGEEPEEPFVPTPAVRKNRRIALISVCVAILVLVLAGAVTFGYLFGVIGDDGLILNNVTVAGVNLGGMTQEEAIKALHKATDLTYTGTDMVVYLPDTTLTFTPANTRAGLDVEAAVQAAYDFGRTGTLSERRAAKQQVLTGEHHIALLPYLNLDTDYIYGQLQDYCNGYNSTYTPSSYSLEGTKPQLDGENFNPEAPCQTLVLYVGTTEQYVDLEDLYNRVLDAYSFNTFQVDASDALSAQQPEPIDLDAIFDKYCSAPSNASMNMDTMEIEDYGVYGYTFDREYAAQLLAEAEYGATIGIPMEYVTPEATAESLKAMLYRDVLSYVETKHTNNKNRNTNLQLACQAINGYVLMPGEVFDYNAVLGERTTEVGYKYAPAYSGGQTVDSIGGGICQVSSTLYYACLLADMEIVERTNHSYISSYIDYGMDATVSWGGPEYKFRNNTAYPVRIEAEVSDGYVKIRLVGTDLKDYYIVMTYRITSVSNYETVYEEYAPDNEEGYEDGEVIQSPYTGYTVRTYRCKYDKITHELISEEEEAFSRYKSRDKIVCVIVDPSQPDEETEPTRPTDPTEPSEPDTQPTEPSQPDTQPTEPSQPDTQPTEPSEPDTQPTEPSQPDTQPTEPSQPDTQPTEPPATDPTQPAEGG